MMYAYVYCGFYRYANHVCVSHSVRTNHGDEWDLPPTTRAPSIFGEPFLLARNG
jgi:hypothetical protein